jgi:hypothetical protein
MADGSDMTMTADPTLGGSVVAGIRSFAAGHGGAKAVIEYAGRRGAKIVLRGEDGAWEDQFVSNTDVARRACESAGIQIENAWERELNDQMRPSRERSRGRRQMSR